MYISFRKVFFFVKTSCCKLIEDFIILLIEVAQENETIELKIKTFQSADLLGKLSFCL